jgi:phospholipid/cholesterol/gamma-HCH transport system substrate-binding protein
MAAVESHRPSVFRTISNKVLGFVLLPVVALLIVGVLLLKHADHSLQLRACFQNVQGLRSGATVRIAGVSLGSVKKVRAQPMNSACPAEVEMELHSDYLLMIPNDAVASVDTEGILGPSYLEIDTTHASGAAIANGGLIRSQESVPATVALERVIKELTEAVRVARDNRKIPGAAPSPSGLAVPAPKPRSN